MLPAWQHLRLLLHWPSCIVILILLYQQIMISLWISPFDHESYPFTERSALFFNFKNLNPICLFTEMSVQRQRLPVATHQVENLNLAVNPPRPLWSKGKLKNNTLALWVSLIYQEWDGILSSQSFCDSRNDYLSLRHFVPFSVYLSVCLSVLLLKPISR